jgi:hypothetical protein
MTTAYRVLEAVHVGVDWDRRARAAAPRGSNRSKITSRWRCPPRATDRGFAERWVVEPPVAKQDRGIDDRSLVDAFADRTTSVPSHLVIMAEYSWWTFHGPIASTIIWLELAVP